MVKKKPLVKKKPSKPHTKKRNSQSSSISKGLWIFTLLMIGGLITFLLYISYTPKHTEVKPPVPIPETKAPPKTVKPQPKFDFYKMLPNKEMHQPKPTPKPAPPVAQTPAPKPPQPPTSIAPKPKPAAPPTNITPATPSAPVLSSYLLNIQSFDTFDEADQLKAELTLLGYPVMIQSINAQGILQFRVCAGPFKNKADALDVQKSLASEQITSVLVEQK